MGGHSKSIAVPEHYRGWKHILLDIDGSKSPDIVLDARELKSLEPDFVDAVYCSHTLEHFFDHEVQTVLAGMKHVLKDDGFVEIVVPDLKAVMEYLVKKNMDIEDVLYVSKIGPITVKDVFYGASRLIQSKGHDFMAHKTGFTPKSLTSALIKSGFKKIYTYWGTRFEIKAIGFKRQPNKYYRELLSLPDDNAQNFFKEQILKECQ